MLIKPPTPSARQVLILIAISVILLGLVADRVNTWWQKRQAVEAATAPLTEKIEATAGINADGGFDFAERSVGVSGLACSQRGFHRLLRAFDTANKFAIVLFPRELARKLPAGVCIGWCEFGGEDNIGRQ